MTGWRLVGIARLRVGGHELQFVRGGRDTVNVSLSDNGEVRLKVVRGSQSLRHPWRERVAGLASSAVMHWTLTGSMRDFPEVPNL